MNYFKTVLIIISIILSSCSHYNTTVDSPVPSLRPRILKGPIAEVHSVVYKAAKRAFPDETENIKIEDNWKISILREWFWRGDTLITVKIEKKQTDEYLVNAESKASWHRLNAAGFGVSKGEIADYFNALDQEYKLYLKVGNRSKLNTSDERTLTNKLREIKRAFEAGLINETEYETKRKEIINQY